MMANASSKLDGLAGATALVYNGTNGTLSCLDPDTEYIECADPTGCGLGPDSLAWDYQVHSEETCKHKSYDTLRLTEQSSRFNQLKTTSHDLA